MISCICITKNKRELLDAAIRCFKNQTYKDKELVIVYERCNPNREYLTRLPYNVIGVEKGKYLLGDLRNMAIERAKGDYIAQWDDDDLSRHDRLEVQMSELKKSFYPGCVLTRWIIYFKGKYFISGRRSFWEGSLLIKKDSIEPYHSKAIDEDRPMVRSLFNKGKLLQLDMPYLYIYNYHGNNTWDEKHWIKLVTTFRQPSEINKPGGIYD